MAATVIYCYDAYCNWCYGFSPVIRRIWETYKGSLDFEVLSGGMLLPGKPVHISVTAAHFAETQKIVEETTGIFFSDDYLWHIHNPEKSDWFPDSQKPATALCVFKEYLPGQQVAFAIALQYALYGEGRDLCDDEAYRGLLTNFAIPPADFYQKLHDPVFSESARHEFELVRQLKVPGYPCLLLQVTDSKFYMLAQGYAAYAAVASRIEAVLLETAIPKK